MPQIPNLAEWTEQQLQKPEILQNMLLAEQEKTETLEHMLASTLVQQEHIENRCKSLVEQLSNIKPHIPTVTPLNPYMTLPMDNLQYPYRFVLLEHYKKGLFSKKQTLLVILYYKGERIFRVEHSKSGLFKQESTKEFTSFKSACTYYMSVSK